MGSLLCASLRSAELTGVCRLSRATRWGSVLRAARASSSTLAAGAAARASPLDRAAHELTAGPALHQPVAAVRWAWRVRPPIESSLEAPHAPDRAE
eukprot:6313567-Prymnesium_polylepis.1